jgi:general secretion pathway protein G
MVKLRLGYTLIELLVVLAIIALLLTISAPRVERYIDQAKEAVLTENLKVMRTAIDAYTADKTRPPASLEALVSEKYLRSVPVDPITERSDTWRITQAQGAVSGQVIDVQSGAVGAGSNGIAYVQY